MLRRPTSSLFFTDNNVYMFENQGLFTTTRLKAGSLASRALSSIGKNIDYNVGRLMVDLYEPDSALDFTARIHPRLKTYDAFIYGTQEQRGRSIGGALRAQTTAAYLREVLHVRRVDRGTLQSLRITLNRVVGNCDDINEARQRLAYNKKALAQIAPSDDEDASRAHAAMTAVHTLIGRVLNDKTYAQKIFALESLGKCLRLREAIALGCWMGILVGYAKGCLLAAALYLSATLHALALGLAFCMIACVLGHAVDDAWDFVIKKLSGQA